MLNFITVRCPDQTKVTLDMRKKLRIILKLQRKKKKKKYVHKYGQNLEISDEEFYFLNRHYKVQRRPIFEL